MTGQLGRHRFSIGCKICFQIWRFERIEKQNAHRVYFDWHALEFWDCDGCGVDSDAIDGFLIGRK